MERFFFNTDIAVEQADTFPGTLTGYAMKWNILSHDRGGYRDTFRKGVFGESINGKDGFDVRAYFNHDSASLLGRVRNSTLSLDTDDVGLRFHLRLPNTTVGRDTAELVSRKDTTGMSFGYVPDDGGYRWKDEKDGLPIREHFHGTLVEVSVVYDPGFPFTEVELSSLGEPADDVLTSLEEWRRQTKETPRKNSAERLLKILELKA